MNWVACFLLVLICSCLHAYVNSQVVCPWGTSSACCFSSFQSGTCSSGQIAQLLDAAGVSGDEFGFSSAIPADGKTGVVGAFDANSGKGKVLIFELDINGNWNPTATLTVSTGANDDVFGWSVGISSDGSTVIVGTYRVSSLKGAAYIFVKSGSSWTTTSTPTATLTVSTGAINDQFGYSVGISSDGSTAIVGAPVVSSFDGAAYIFVKNGASWTTTSTPTATLTLSGGADGDQFGISAGVSSDGNTAIVGAYGVSSSKGAAYIFVKSGASWTTTSTPTATLTLSGGSNYDYFGASVGVSSDGNTAIVGAYGVSSSKGAAYIFVKSGASWTTTFIPTATLTASGGAESDLFGISVGISSDGNTAIVGAYGVSSNKGAAYIFGSSCGSAVSCDNGNACDGTETCSGTTCVAGTALTCSDGNACNGLETCNPVSGCVAGTALTCNDGNACNGLETCNPASGCVAGTALTCNDGNACNGLETCNPVSGCAAGTAPICDDGNPCNGVETCNPASGCKSGSIPCPDTDGNPCNGAPSCNPGTGACIPPAGPLPCGFNGCLPGSGCKDYCTTNAECTPYTCVGNYCKGLSVVGERCDPGDNSDCHPPYQCSAFGNTIGLYICGGMGATCSNNDDLYCKKPLVCLLGICKYPLQSGSSCVEAADCQHGECRKGCSVSKKACSNNSQCTGGGGDICIGVCGGSQPWP